MNKKNITPLALGAMAIAIIGSGLYANTAAAYFGNEGQKTNLIEQLSERFNLSQDDLKIFFEEKRAEQKEKFAQRGEVRLDQAVANGELTEAQKQLILTKRSELQASFAENKDTFKNLSVEERKVLHEEKRAEIENWAEENNIDPKYLHPHKGHKKRHFRGKHSQKKFKTPPNEQLEA